MLYPRRLDAESINRGIDDSLCIGRAHSLGHARQHLNLLGYAIMVNGLALHRYQHRAPDQLAALGAVHDGSGAAASARRTSVGLRFPALDRPSANQFELRAAAQRKLERVFLPGILRSLPLSGL